jgi:hypothetical protein
VSTSWTYQLILSNLKFRVRENGKGKGLRHNNIQLYSLQVVIYIVEFIIEGGAACIRE